MNESADSGQEVCVWDVDLNVPRLVVSRLERLLPSPEREEAYRCASLREARRFIVRRAARRLILAEYMNVSPSRLRILVDSNGKPRLAQPTRVEFSCADADDLAVIAVTKRWRVGVDVERFHHVPDALSVAENFFSQSECSELRKASPSFRDELFLRYWTCKEALLKATGRGLSLALDSFKVSPGTVQAPLQVSDSTGQPIARWHLSALDPAPGYIGAIACEASSDCRNLSIERLSFDSATAELSDVSWLSV